MARVFFTEPSEYDLISIEHYIFVNLSNPQAAINITDGIKNSARKLEKFPEANPFVNDDILRNLKIRKTSFGNYNIFYYYEKASDTVFIIRVLYNKQDWRAILKD